MHLRAPVAGTGGGVSGVGVCGQVPALEGRGWRGGALGLACKALGQAEG